MPFKIVRNDITKMQVDAIVNTANELPVYSDGTDRAVYLAAGAEDLLVARREIGVLAEGDVALTPGFRLPAKYIIHAVSPFYREDSEEAEAKLRSCYRKSLALAYEKKCESIAFPLIATGSYGYPKEEGMRIALDEINAFLLTHEMMIYLVVFDEASTGLGKKLYPDLEAYIDRNYVEERQEEEYKGGLSMMLQTAPVQMANRVDESLREKKTKGPKSEKRKLFGGRSISPAESSPLQEKKLCDASVSMEAAEGSADVGLSGDAYDAFLEQSESAIKERLAHLSDTFQEYLLYLIESKGLTNAEVYKRAIITKQLFSKIKLNPGYHPDKATAMRLCVGAELSLDETKDLLARAGYALSPCDKRDIIFSYFIEHGVFDMIEIDIALEEHGLPCFIE